jgi:hypothetical protein
MKLRPDLSILDDEAVGQSTVTEFPLVLSRQLGSRFSSLWREGALRLIYNLQFAV